MLMDTR